MRIEFLSTGNELLDGSVLDTNAQYFEAGVQALGAAVVRQQTLPDDRAALVEAMRTLGMRADFVVTSGGMGPTLDDLTVEAAAEAMEVALETDEATLARIRERFAKRNFVFTPNNARQARIPHGGEAIPNPYGTAPLVMTRIGRALFFHLPGVPSEFRGLCDTVLFPRLEEMLRAEPGRRYVAARTLKVFGMGESHLDARVAELPARHPEVYFGFRTHFPENHLKLRASGTTQAEADERLARAEREARDLLGEGVFGGGGDEYAAVVLERLRRAGETLALAESCTGGACAAMLAVVPGASDVLVSSAVVYQDRAKSQLLGLPPELVASEGAVSEEVTRELVRAARARSGATYGIAITGFAGPTGGASELPVGTIFVALDRAEGTTVQRHRLAYDRERVIRYAAYLALEQLRRSAG